MHGSDCSRVTYLQFHLVFLLPPLLVLGWLTRAYLTRRRLALMALLGVVAIVYTFPWDSLLIARGVWGYPPGRVLATIGVIPAEEVAFFVLQPLLVLLWTVWLLRDRPVPPVDRGSRAARAAGAALGIGVALLGLWLLRVPEGTYLGLMLAWAGPVLALQWGYGGPALLRLARPWLLGVGVPALYLCLADRFAIASGIWHFDDALLTGWHVGGLPFEEGLFFFVTSAFVVQGFLLGLARTART
ncbi:MAG: lycopene cyclase domain-containing protein [Rubricoccaceae bacterium]